MAFQYSPNPLGMLSQSSPNGAGGYSQQSSPGGFNGYTFVSQNSPQQGLLNQLLGWDQSLGRYNNGGKMATRDAMGGIKNLLGAFGGGGMSGSGSGSSGGKPVGGYDALSDKLTGMVDQSGGAQREAINRAYDTSLDASLAGLSDRGFGNSSLVDSTQGASQRNRQSSLLGLNDALLGQKIGIGSNVGLAGLNAANQQNNMAQQFQYQMLGNLFGGLFG